MYGLQEKGKNMMMRFQSPLVYILTTFGSRREDTCLYGMQITKAQIRTGWSPPMLFIN